MQYCSFSTKVKGQGCVNGPERPSHLMWIAFMADVAADTLLPPPIACSMPHQSTAPASMH